MALRLVRLGATVVALAPTVGQAGVAQTLRAAVIAEVGATPIPGASVVARSSRIAAETDRLGRFSLHLTVLPDTVVIAAIGWAPDTLFLASVPAEPLTISLAKAPVVVSDLIVTVPPRRSAELSEHGHWRMPLSAARVVPPAVEPDIYRALSLIPGVSFTSPLSARPIVRGYDAQETTTRIDGFEVLNLFHLGRTFASFPADAAEEITVHAAPYTRANGGSIAGLVDITGRTGPAQGVEGGGGASFGSLSGYAGGGNDRLRLFASGRVFHAKLLELIPGVDVPYQFEDFYSSAVVGPPARPRGRLTLFATQDKAGKPGEPHLAWDNVLVGTRWRLLDGGSSSLDVATAAARFRETGRRVPSLHAGAADFDNQFSRVTANLDWALQFTRGRADASFQIGRRAVGNEVRPAGGSLGAMPTALTRAAQAEIALLADVSRQFGPFAAEVAIRADRLGPLTAVQPRFHVRWSLMDRAAISFGIGRTARLYHLLSEARSEPDFDFLDFWLASANGIPNALVDHATAELNVDLAPFIGRLSTFASRGSGIGELRPPDDQVARLHPFFRFGRSRTYGLEAQVAIRGQSTARHSASMSYVLSHSLRDWGEGWSRWAQDRRHQFRGFGQLRRGRLSVFGALDAATGMPLTPVQYQAGMMIPELPTTTFPTDPRAVFGRENSAMTSGTFRVDAGFTGIFDGPGESRFTVGASVINLFSGPVAPITTVGQGRGAVDRLGQPTSYRRLFDLPPIPTITLRLEFP